MLLLLGFAFLAGLVTIFAPCIWPLLPIVLSSAAGGKHSTRPAGVTLGIMLSFTVFTLAISSLARVFHLDPNILRTIAVVIIAILGVFLLIPKLSHLLENAISRLSGRFGTQSTPGTDFRAGFLTGLSLGILWAPCAGPILATIAALAATGQVSWYVVALTLSYVTGVGIPLFFLAYGGQQFLTKSRTLTPYTGRIRQAFGAIMILAALAIYTNYDKVLQLKLINTFPALGSALTSIEEGKTVQTQLRALTGNKGLENSNAFKANSSLYNAHIPARELVGINTWLNTNGQALSLKDLKGKVVLIDFWTYTCINCLRTLPHVTSWYNTYKDQGLVVIGVHTPEFPFEKKTENVLQAIKSNGILYPVAQDNDFATWNNYENQYWPAKYLIDANGIIRHTHFGEGSYDETEEAIKGLLQEAGAVVTTTTATPVVEDRLGRHSPETYLGSARAEYFYPERTLRAGEKNYTLVTSPPKNTFSLGGTWAIDPEKATSGKGATLTHRFEGAKVFLVLRPGMNTKATVRVLLDGKPVGLEQLGEDVQNGIVTVDQDRLYTLIDLHGPASEHTLKLEFQNPGTEAFAFTFG